MYFADAASARPIVDDKCLHHRLAALVERWPFEDMQYADDHAILFRNDHAMACRR